jgi:hypothetical protein
MLPTHPLCPHHRPGSSICVEVSCLFYLHPAVSCFPPTHPVLIPVLAAQYVQRFPVFSTSSLQPHASHPPTLSLSQTWQINMCRDILSFPPSPCSLILNMGIFLCMYFIQHCFICRPQVTLCRKMLILILPIHPPCLHPRPPASSRHAEISCMFHLLSRSLLPVIAKGLDGSSYLCNLVPAAACLPSAHTIHVPGQAAQHMPNTNNNLASVSRQSSLLVKWGLSRT